MASLPRLPEAPKPPASVPGSTCSWLGGSLVGASFALWLPLPVLPFLPLSVTHKAAAAAALVGSAAVAFWVGLALAGPALARRLRGCWRRDRNHTALGGVDLHEA